MSPPRSEAEILVTPKTDSWVKSGWSRGRPPSNRPKRLVAGASWMAHFRGRHIDESLTSPTPSYCRAGATVEPKT